MTPIHPNKSYAQAVKNASAIFDQKKSHDCDNKKLKKSREVAHNKIHNTCSSFNDKDKGNLSTVTGVPVKYGKCVSVKRSVPCKPIMTELRNRFQCLQDCVVGDDVIHDDIHLNNVENHRDASIHVGAVSERIKHKKQHSEECKTSLSGSNDMLRPKLAFKQNCFLEGNKNKTGLLDVVSYNIEELDNDSALIEKQDFSGAVTLTNTFDERNLYEMQAGKKFGPQLAPGNSFLDGNKNKTGVFDGDRSHVSIMEASQEISQTAITAGASNQVATEILQPVLYENCGLNTCETMQCGNDYMEVYTKQKYRNMVNNSEHDFGFCPLTNLT